MKAVFTYACRDYPGMEQCPGQFSAETESEIWKLLEVHATVAHGENPSAWTAEDRAFLKGLIKSANT